MISKKEIKARANKIIKHHTDVISIENDKKIIDMYMSVIIKSSIVTAQMRFDTLWEQPEYDCDFPTDFGREWSKAVNDTREVVDYLIQELDKFRRQ